MKLQVLPPKESPWYADGLHFTCTQCGNCCTGGPGFVWIEKDEIVKLAEHLNLTPEQTVERYCRKIDGRFSLKERRTHGTYDCIFLKEQKVESTTPAGERTVATRKMCSVYPVRPLQCRTWPFWPENLTTPRAWKDAAKRCHGMNTGHRHFTQPQIESIRDAAQWPTHPPTSAPQSDK